MTLPHQHKTWAAFPMAQLNYLSLILNSNCLFMQVPCESSSQLKLLQIIIFAVNTISFLFLFTFRKSATIMLAESKGLLSYYYKQLIFIYILDKICRIVQQIQGLYQNKFLILQQLDQLSLTFLPHLPRGDCRWKKISPLSNFGFSKLNSETILLTMQKKEKKEIEYKGE